ncbi:MAG: phage tail protein [Pseudomonadota bacterium]
MATIVLSAVGSAIGGPIGSTIGAIIGNQVDKAIFGGGSREGPRLKELAVTTSTYGQPMARHFGRMRVAGTVIWSTDLIESSSREGGGKGKPSVKTYSYSISFAVALSSTPIARLGRIWADGNLLRGANGDLKIEGTLRTYLGTGDNPVDPLIAADKGEQAPAFRDCAYVVFEDLQLADYGNRIPALTFEVFSEEDSQVTLGQIVPLSRSARSNEAIPYTQGFADEGGPILSSISAIDRVIPLSCVTTAQGLVLDPVSSEGSEPRLLPEQLSSPSDGDATERSKQRAGQIDQAPTALRYYDEGRDYQPGVQRSVGSRPNGLESMIDLPATMNADGARQLANESAQRARWLHERITWRIAQLDPAIGPGTLVRIPDTPGQWLVKSWEWFDQGVELTLERAAPQIGGSISSDSGSLIPPVDLPSSPSELLFFELPSDGTASPTDTLLFAAASSATPWRGTALYAEQGSSLMPIGVVDSRRAVIGSLVEDLEPSSIMLLEPSAKMLIRLAADDLNLEGTDVAGLAAGSNRIMIGGEVLQFLDAQPQGDGMWLLQGLLRGRAGTEDFASEIHYAGLSCALLDDRITPIDPAQVVALPGSRIAAIGHGDETPVFATLSNAGLSRRTPSPVHPRAEITADGDWAFCWTRRARGHWRWDNGVDVPLVEEQESYLIGFGPTQSPYKTWSVAAPHFALSAPEHTALVNQHQTGELWVRQVGTFAASAPLFLASIS